MTARRFDAVIFDLDGTLLATEQMTIETGEAALARMGRVAPDGLLASLVGFDEPTSRVDPLGLCPGA